MNRGTRLFSPRRPRVGAAAREHVMPTKTTRRDVVKGSLALAGLGILGVPEWALPALAQEEEVVPVYGRPRNVRTTEARGLGAYLRYPHYRRPLHAER